MVVDIYAHELAEPVGPAELSEVINKACWMPCKTDDSSVNIDDEGVWSVYLCTSRQSNV
jgi:hypothetical protein